MPSSSRPLNALEQKIHQACVTHEKKMMAQKEVDALVPDVNARVAAINFLLSAGMLKIMQDEKKQISYKAVMKKEMEVKKEMGGDENMVLNHIQNSGNEGIWTKHLKAKTELHQTVITRCLKSLEQKGLVKVVKSVKNPTRKIYMMSHLEPSVEVTGGPWYSENELDTEFIKMLTSACLRFIQDKSYPKVSSSSEGLPTPSAAPLFPISQATAYPTSKQIHSWLQKTRLSEQELGVEHVEMLLDVLVFDGEVERLPAYGAGMWDMDAMDAGSEDERREKKRKRKAEESERKKTKKTKGKKRSRKGDSSAEESSEEGSRKQKKRKVKVKDESEDEKKPKAKKRKREDSDDEGSGAGSDSDSANEQRNSKKRKTSSHSTKTKLKSKSSRQDTSSSSESSNESSDSSSSTRKRKKPMSSAKSSKSRKSKSAVMVDSEPDDSDGVVDLGGLGSANVYRAVRQERLSLGWTQAPCGRCPVFDFCSESGPVNPKECSYYASWVQQGVADF